MLRVTLLTLLFLISLISSFILRKSALEECYVIEGFVCKCSSHHLKCTNGDGLPSEIVIYENEEDKYLSVELIITAEMDIEINDQTFEPIKELYKSDGNSLKFHIKFEKYTALHLSSSGIFNRVFPDHLPLSTTKNLILEMYNPLVQPQNDKNLFQDSNLDLLDLYALYPWDGTFQELFHGANIKYLRLSGADVRLDFSQSFTGNIARLEIAKQASELTVENFPPYPVHELIINCFYITVFNSKHPPNYENLAELYVHTSEGFPANAFRQFPNLKVLSLSTENNIDLHTLDDLDQLEKLIIKNTNISLSLLNNVPNVKELQIEMERFDDKTQCQLIEKLANGQIAISDGTDPPECNCITAYLNSAYGQKPCKALPCQHSSCATIKNKYCTSTRTFKAPRPIYRSDNSNALKKHQARVYTKPYQITEKDQKKFNRAFTSDTPSSIDENHFTTTYGNEISTSNDYTTENKNEDSTSKETLPSFDPYDEEVGFDYTVPLVLNEPVVPETTMTISNSDLNDIRPCFKKVYDFFMKYFISETKNTI